MEDEEFNRKITQSRRVETILCKWYQDNIDISSTLPPEYSKYYDILVPAVDNVEVKEDLMACHTGNYAIEYEDFQGNPSGIHVTTSGEFVFVDHEYVVRMKTESLRYLLSQLKHKRSINMGFKTLDGRQAKGWLIPREMILGSAYGDIMKRWF